MPVLTPPTSPTVPTAADRVRQCSVTIAEILCVVGTLLGVGVLGTRVSESAGGALSADATHLAPAGPAFSIWSVIYAGLLGYTVWQWLPGQTTSARHRALGPFVVASMLLNAMWLLVTQWGLLWVSVGVIVALLASLVRVATVLEEHPAHGAERVVTDGTLGLYFGWVNVAVVANIAAALAAEGLRPRGSVADWLGAAVLAVVAVVGVAVAYRFGARWSVAGAMVWGLGWITYGRLEDAPRSTVVAGAAVLAAVVIIVGTASAFLRRRRTRHETPPRPA